MIKFKIRSGDEVVVVCGRDKGKSGKVMKVFPQTHRVILGGINVVVKHSKPTQNSEGGIIKKEKSIHISNLAILDPKENKPSKVGFKFLKDGEKVRFAKLSGEVIKVNG